MARGISAYRSDENVTAAKLLFSSVVSCHIQTCTSLSYLDLCTFACYLPRSSRTERHMPSFMIGAAVLLFKLATDVLIHHIPSIEECDEANYALDDVDIGLVVRSEL